MTVDENLAHQWLSSASYYRLSAYWYPARRTNERVDAFIEGTTFVDAVALYEADRKLRTLIHDGMEPIEITMRTRVGELLCTVDPLSYCRWRPSVFEWSPKRQKPRWVTSEPEMATTRWT